MSQKIVQVMPVKQDGRTLLLTALSAKDLLDYTTISKYRADLPPTDMRQGYQRPEEKARAKKVAKYLVQTPAVLLPTAILLSARDDDLVLDEESGHATLDDSRPLQIVDGQHRIAGLRYAIHELRQTGLIDFRVPVVIMMGLSKLDEMRQFSVVNGTQKSVRTDLVNMILSQIVAGEGEEAIPQKDLWKVVVSRTIEHLNRDPESVWYDKIVMPDQTAYSRDEVERNPDLAGRRIVRATSFMQSLRPVYRYLSEYHHIPSSWDLDQQAGELARIVTDYWNAIAAICPEPFETPKDYVIQKTPGVFSLHTVLIGLIRAMHIGRRQLRREEFEFMLGPAEDTQAEVLSEAFWRAADGRASDFGSMKGFADLAEIIAAEIGIDL